MTDKPKLNLTPAAINAAFQGDIENFLVAATPGGIEAQEAAGQKALVENKDVLPIDCPRADLETLGFVFGEQLDDIFVRVTFPQGWKKQNTNHSMWSDLIDDKGRKRAEIFYKAAFYDRHARIGRMNQRYTVERKYTDNGNNEPFNVCDQDGTVLFTAGTANSKEWDKQDGLIKKCEDWLNQNFPDWQNPLAYWD